MLTNFAVLALSSLPPVCLLVCVCVCMCVGVCVAPSVKCVLCDYTLWRCLTSQVTEECSHTTQVCTEHPSFSQHKHTHTPYQTKPYINLLISIALLYSRIAMCQGFNNSSKSVIPKRGLHCPVMTPPEVLRCHACKNNCLHSWTR